MSDKYGKNLIWFLEEVQAGDDDYIESHHVDIYGETESGLEGSCQIDIRELCGEAAKTISELQAKLAAYKGMDELTQLGQEMGDYDIGDKHE